MELNTIHWGNCISVISSEIPDESIDLVVTSPPYDNLRSYKGYSFDFEGIARQLGRVLKPGGVIVWVVGDQVIKGSESGNSFRQALFFMSPVGLRLHDTMIYQKNGAAYPPNDKSNRYGQTFEYMFVFSKGKPKTANLLKDKPNKWAGFTNFGDNSERMKDGSLKARKKKGEMIIQEFGYRNNIWRIKNGFGYTTKDKFAYEHPAMFPEELARDHIITWSNPGDEVVLDPMGGSGTTAIIAHSLGRKFITIDISKEYCELTQKRFKHRFNLDVEIM